jgi:hypothetical protein
MFRGSFLNLVNLVESLEPMGYLLIVKHLGA